MDKKTRSIALVLALVVAFVMLFSSVFVTLETHHDCDGEHCQSCYQIEIYENTLRTLADALLVASVVAVSTYFIMVGLHVFTTNKRIETLVTLKVKLLN